MIKVIFSEKQNVINTVRGDSHVCLCPCYMKGVNCTLVDRWIRVFAGL